TPAKSDAALRDIRKALEKYGPELRRFLPNFNALVQANVAKHQRAKFKSFFCTAAQRGEVDLEKITRRGCVSKEVFDKWMNTPKVATLVNNFLNLGRRQRAKTVVVWAKTLPLKAPIDADVEILADGIDYLPLAKRAALAFESPESFRESIELALDVHK